MGKRPIDDTNCWNAFDSHTYHGCHIMQETFCNKHIQTVSTHILIHQYTYRTVSWFCMKIDQYRWFTKNPDMPQCYFYTMFNKMLFKFHVMKNEYALPVYSCVASSGSIHTMISFFWTRSDFLASSRSVKPVNGPTWPEGAFDSSCSSDTSWSQTRIQIN